MSDDSIVELYGDELVAIYNALKEMRLTRVPQGTKHIDEFLNRYDVKLAIRIEEEERKEKHARQLNHNGLIRSSNSIRNARALANSRKKRRSFVRRSPTGSQTNSNA